MREKLVAILLPDLRGGGAERAAVNLANGFVERGLNVHFVLMEARGELLPLLSPEIRVVSLGAPRMRAILVPLVKYLRRAKPIALVASMWPVTIIAIMARALALERTRVVVTEHTTWSASQIYAKRLRRYLLRSSMRLLFPMADSIVCVSRGSADDLAKVSGLKRSSVRVIYNPIELAALRFSGELNSVAPIRWWEGEHRRVLAVGTLKQIKDYPTLLRAFAILRTRVDARLLILGEGQCRAELESLIRVLGIEKFVDMPGYVDNPAPFYRRADLHVLSSRGEGLPTVIVEALAAGTPVVSTDCPSGPREILADEKFGRLVPVGDCKALAEAMGEALAEIPDRQALRQRAQAFGLGLAVDSYLDVLLPNNARS